MLVAEPFVGRAGSLKCTLSVQVVLMSSHRDADDLTSEDAERILRHILNGEKALERSIRKIPRRKKK